MGTVTTGTGIVPPLTVGKGAISPASVGALSTQLNLTGSWSVDLKGSEIRHLDLQMFQESDLIMGSGQMLAGGANKAVTVAGSVAGDRLTVFVSAVDKPEVFRLELSASGTALAGQFDSLSSSLIRESGTVTGSMALSSQQNQPTVLGRSLNPSASSGALLGRETETQNGLDSSDHIIESKSVYKSSNGQSVSSTSEGTQVTSSYG
jgi:flagellar hook-associated protein FlgK